MLQIFSKDAASFFPLWFFTHNKREVNQKLFDHIHATSHPHIRLFQKWWNLKELICNVTLNNEFKVLQQAVVYIK